MVTYAPDEIGLADTSPCAAVRADLKSCLLESDCCRKDKKTPRECLKDGAVPDECAQLRTLFFECKRSIRPINYLEAARIKKRFENGIHSHSVSLTSIGVYTHTVKLDARRRFRGHKGY